MKHSHVITEKIRSYYFKVSCDSSVSILVNAIHAKQLSKILANHCMVLHTSYLLAIHCQYAGYRILNTS